MKNLFPSQIITTRVLQTCELPHCLTSGYQALVAKITTLQDPDRGAGKKTGIWDETNRCSD
ncbi:hypothetical protein K2X92_02745 [Candidatus Gracilibacteria bacterium]|nr:hypothetical protein [Candidatus Gracilibacteria bacterium]